MTRHAWIPLAILLTAPAFAQEKPAPDAPSGKMENLLQNCDAHKFETTVETTVDGKPHSSKLKMCGNEGQSDAEWINTLKDAVTKTEANSTMSESMRNQIVSAIKAEIARLESGGTPAADAGSLPAGRPRPTTADTLANDYSVLPPLPKSNPAPTRVLNAPATPPTAAVADSSPTIVASNPVPAPAAAPPLPPPAKPKLSLTCISPDFPSGGPCVTISRDTFLNVKAGEPIGPGVALRFVRQGVPKAEFALGSMRKGQSLRFPLPQPVCSGVVSGEVEIAVVRNGSVVDRQGPSLLHC